MPVFVPVDGDLSVRLRNVGRAEVTKKDLIVYILARIKNIYEYDSNEMVSCSKKAKKEEVGWVPIFQQYYYMSLGELFYDAPIREGGMPRLRKAHDGNKYDYRIHCFTDFYEALAERSTCIQGLMGATGLLKCIIPKGTKVVFGKIRSRELRDKLGDNKMLLLDGVVTDCIKLLEFLHKDFKEWLFDKWLPTAGGGENFYDNSRIIKIAKTVVKEHKQELFFTDIGKDYE